MSKVDVRVTDIVRVTDSVVRIELRALSGPLPRFTAGAHIDMHLPSGVSRSYSILSSQDEPDRYLLGIAREDGGRGGSRFIHASLTVGDRLSISQPRNLFSLAEDAAVSVLIGGGIGVTPLLSMIARLEGLGRNWTLHYCARSREVAPFLDFLDRYGDHVHLRMDDESSGLLDIAALMRASPDAHFYCCGPVPMLAAFEQASRETHLPDAQKHLEYFKPQGDPEQLGGFVVELARSRQEFVVSPGTTILDALREAGITTTSSCEAGICGECQVGVLSGVPDHQDMVLTDAERASNTMMMICCSGSKSDRLVLDI